MMNERSQCQTNATHTLGICYIFVGLDSVSGVAKYTKDNSDSKYLKMPCVILSDHDNMINLVSSLGMCKKHAKYLTLKYVRQQPSNVEYQVGGE